MYTFISLCSILIYVILTVYSTKKVEHWGWKDGKVVKITCCAYKGLEFSSQHPVKWLTTLCHSGSR